MKVVFTLAISGRLPAASMNFCVCWARNATSLPARSSSTIETPPEVPTPGMAGGGNPKACASDIAPSFALMVRKIGRSCSSGLWRSSHGASVTKRNPLYVVLTVLSRLNPTTVVAYWTPGTSLSIASIFLQTSSVRWREDAAGNWTFK